ncbi:DUF397 domain-containing protein [Streptomyces sp. NPDC101181]|uniref:DUF397 domain-containing protein n=1 Tax=Streptomyces sp. NPDC101181 TaxID=3366125 RepID=UPI0037F81758
MTAEPPRWFTSSYSENGGACVEVATNLATTPRGVVPVRDSKNATGPLLTLPAEAFTAFVAGVRNGHFGNGHVDAV